MTEALACKTCTPCRGGMPPLMREQAELFHAPAPDWQLTGGKLTASSGASGFVISGRRLPLFRRLVNSRKLKAHHPNISFGWGSARSADQEDQGTA